MAEKLARRIRMANIQINMDSLNPTSFKKTVRHKVLDGSNIYRFLPPFGSESNGYPYRKWNVIWGLVDPTSGRMRPFASSSTFEGRCPVYDYLDILKQKVEDLKKTGAADEKVTELEKYISAIRPKSVYAYNASDKSGIVGVLELKSTAHKKVISLMNEYITQYNQDPTSLNSAVADSGVWFKISRAGTGFNTTYDAAKNQNSTKDPNTGALVYQDDRGPLVDSVVENFDALAYDLNNIYQKLSYDDLKDILIANLVSASDALPELLVPGFGLDDVSGGNVEQPVSFVQAATPVTPVVPVTETVVAPVATQTPATANTDDLLAMADDIFNS